MVKKIFIDGSAGTTGLKIFSRLKDRKDIFLLTLSEENRKDIQARKNILNEADLAFLCLPDNAAVEAVNLIENENTVLIDTSTAHRVSDEWAYGMPEIKNQREKIINSKRIANPGCHASGVIALIAPLIENKILNPEIKFSCFSITGYSGGGKKMISEYENSQRPEIFNAPRQYGLSQNHKHVPEIMKICNLKFAPIFCPIVASYFAGMEVTVTLNNSDINGNVEDIKKIYEDYYKNGMIYFEGNNSENGFLSAGKLAGRDDMEISIFGNDERILLVSRFDNLGKGASGAAIQNMNLILGFNEFEGLNYERKF